MRKITQEEFDNKVSSLIANFLADYGANTQPTSKPKSNIELDELISARYDNMLRTIIVSKLTPAEIKDRIKYRAYDRLKGNNAQVIVLDGESMRG